MVIVWYNTHYTHINQFKSDTYTIYFYLDFFFAPLFLLQNMRDKRGEDWLI